MTLYVVPFMLFLLASDPALAGTDSGMPYGYYLYWHSAYGICKQNLGPEETELALTKYFESRGLRAENILHRDRFTRADIYKGDQLVDKILFDRKTGRIRSIY